VEGGGVSSGHREVSGVTWLASKRLQTCDERGEVLLLLASTVQRFEHFPGVDLAVAQTLRPIASDFTLNELAEHFGDRSVTRGRSEVRPHVISDGHASHAVSTSRRCVARLIGRLLLGSLSAPSSHGCFRGIVHV
jgi:hypothetical protein